MFNGARACSCYRATPTALPMATVIEENLATWTPLHAEFVTPCIDLLWDFMHHVWYLFTNIHDKLNVLYFLI